MELSGIGIDKTEMTPCLVYILDGARRSCHWEMLSGDITSETLIENINNNNMYGLFTISIINNIIIIAP